MMDIESYKNYLLKNGIDMSAEGLNTYILDYNNALAVIDILENIRTLILGGNVFMKEGNIISMTYDNWYTKDLKYDDSYKVAREYINLFKDKKDKVFFDITILDINDKPFIII